MMKKPLKIISWNVNGLRAVIKKGFHDFLETHNPDILCLQEVKACEATVPRLEIPFTNVLFHCGERKGYSGTAIFSKLEPLSFHTHCPLEVEVREGRVAVAEYEGWYVVSVYTPNSKAELERLSYRHRVWDPGFLQYVQMLEQTKPVVICGDLNVAHQPIDLEHPEANRFSPGFTDEERAGFDRLMDAGFIDTFRHFYPDTLKQYSWWSYRSNARSRNVGWRIDYCLASASLKPRLHSASILQNVMGSDHAPVELQLI